jgi:hypothetical protein
VQTPGGVRYWWSPLLGRASLEVPEQPWGGWCAEEMGLGKVGCWRPPRARGCPCKWSLPIFRPSLRRLGAAHLSSRGPRACPTTHLHRRIPTYTHVFATHPPTPPTPLPPHAPTDH